MAVAPQHSTASGTSGGQEFVVRVPKLATDKKRHHVMRFNSSMKIDFSSWKQGRLERENNMRDVKVEEEMPKFGAGSEFGRQQREEARRRKYGMAARKYNPDDQPWLLKIGGKNGKKYRGLREGGVTENASYYVFTKASDGAFEAFPIEEWYNFIPVQTYKTLNAEEAEEEFGRRDKVFNYFSIMMKKRLKTDEGNPEEVDEKAKKGSKKNGSGDFKISDMDDWVHSSEGEEEDDEEGGSDKEKANKEKKKKNLKNTKKKKKKKMDSDDEGVEESDDGDEEGREVDYISDESSNSEDLNETKNKGELKGVEDEEAIRKMENSETDEDEEEEEKKENPAEKEEPAKESKEKREDKSSSETSSDSSDSDDFDESIHSAMFMPDKKKDGSAKKTPKKIKKESANNRGNNSKSTEKSSTNEGKRPASDSDKLEGFAAKRIKLEHNNPSTSSSPSISSPICMDGITEDAVRRYLMRKPLTATELLQKFRSKKNGLSREQMVNTITQILKRLNPDKTTVKGKMYLSMKHSQ